MRALTIALSAAAFLAVSAFAADTQVKQSAQSASGKIVLVSTSVPVSASMPRVQKEKAPVAAKTEAPVRVWSLEMACCEPQ